MQFAKSLICSFALVSSPLAAQELPIPTITQNVSGVPVNFSGRMTFTVGGNCQRLDTSLFVDLRDLAAKTTQIVHTAGVNRSASCGETVRLNQVNMNRSGTGLAIKADGFVSKQECVKTKVPEFRGLKVTMKTRTVASNTFATNTSVRAVFMPEVTDSGRALHMTLSGTPELSVSNDAYRFLLDAFNLRGGVEGKIRDAAQSALAAPQATAILPPALTQFGLVMKDARIVDDAGKLALRVAATVPVPQAQLRQVTRTLGLANLCR